jgi:hypothetical protein
MASFRKLFIYDTGDEDNREQAEGRFDKSDDLVPVPCASQAELEVGLDKLLKEGKVFNRVLFQTHGRAGALRFGDDEHKDAIYNVTFQFNWAKKGYDALFPVYTKIYFDGCNVGEGDEGTDFMEAAGGCFLKRAGGEVKAFINPGYGMSLWIPFLGGHTIHFHNGLKVFFFNAGGKRADPPPYVDRTPNAPGNIGNKI